LQSLERNRTTNSARPAHQERTEEAIPQKPDTETIQCPPLLRIPAMTPQSLARGPRDLYRTTGFSKLRLQKSKALDSEPIRGQQPVIRRFPAFLPHQTTEIGFPVSHEFFEHTVECGKWRGIAMPKAPIATCGPRGPKHHTRRTMHPSRGRLGSNAHPLGAFQYPTARTDHLVEKPAPRHKHDLFEFQGNLGKPESRIGGDSVVH
jgi:hypothetical protein